MADEELWESVQRRAVRMIFNPSGSYEWKLFSLEENMAWGDDDKEGQAWHHQLVQDGYNQRGVTMP